MTFQERNDYVIQILADFKVLHDKYTSSTALLSDNEWETYINSMENVTSKYKNTNLFDFVGDLQMAFLDDTEKIQKKLKRMRI